LTTQDLLLQGLAKQALKDKHRLLRKLKTEVCPDMVGGSAGSLCGLPLRRAA